MINKIENNVFANKILFVALLILLAYEFLSFESVTAKIIPAVVFIAVAIMGYFHIKRIRRIVKIEESIKETDLKIEEINGKKETIFYIINKIKTYFNEIKSGAEIILNDKNSKINDEGKKKLQMLIDDQNKGLRDIDIFIHTHKLEN